MKKLFYFLLLVLLFPVLSHAQETEDLFIEWFGDDEIANELVERGIGHLMNIEREKAFTFFDAAVAQDPSLFGPHIPLSWMSSGDQKAYHKVQAQKLVVGKNEPSRLYASLLDLGQGSDGAQVWRNTWKKMHEVAPNGKYIHFQYALSLTDPAAQIAELDRLRSMLDDEDGNSGHVHNILGYLHYAEGNKTTAKEHFETYLQLSPDRYNAYDSMGEYYFNEGKYEKAKSYYKKAQAHYPPSNSAREKLEEIEDKMDMAGELVLVTTEYVHPAHMADYIQWGKEYKAIADQTNFDDFSVSSTGDAFHYASFVGKHLEDIEKRDKKWQEWVDSNEDLRALFQKYKHSISGTKRSVWRHSPKYSYTPEDHSAEGPNKYVRSYQGTVKFGHEEAVKEVLAAFKEEWSKNGISRPYSVYWNVFGEDGPCVAFRSAYPDVSAWMDEQGEINEKIGQDRLSELMTEWNKHIKTWKEVERFPRPDLSHSNEASLVSND